MSLLQVNFVAVLIAAIAAMVVGAVWYSKMLFAKQWMALIGKTEQELKSGNMMQSYVLMFIGALVEAYVLAHFIAIANVRTAIGGAKVGVWAAIGFVAAAALGDVIFAGRPQKLYLINVGYQLVVLIIMGAILGAMP